MYAPSRVRRLLAAVVSVALVSLPQAGAAEEPHKPDLRLFSTQTEPLKLIRYKKRRPVYLYTGMYLTPSGGPFELQVGRATYTDPVGVKQILRTSEGTVAVDLPADILQDNWFGLADFLTIEARNAAGDVVRSKTGTLCPNGWEKQRVNDSGPVTPRYPDIGCYGQPFTKSLVWGIDEGWAVNLFGDYTPRIKVPDGTYSVTVSVSERYRDLFDIADENGSTTFDIIVKTKKRSNKCRSCAKPHNPYRQTQQASEGSPPIMDNPDPSILPDLIPLPSWGISTRHYRKSGRDFLSFGANVWVAGADSLVVEGFRRSGEEVMDAWQYFHDASGNVVGRAPVGALEFDNRRGHNHWHFLQFAQYELLDATQTNAVRSEKEAFCLAPTDAIDLSLPNAVWSPGSTGLHTACGYKGSIWIREILPLGWGDTYYQGMPGQSFDITNLPNGTYYIAVTANPDGNLHEQDTTNNTELREVILKGKPGSRRVIVPPWNGIDTEGGETGPR